MTSEAGMLNSLVRDVELLSVEEELRKQGYSFSYAVDFAEQFNYLHPFLEQCGQGKIDDEAWEATVRYLIAITYLIDGSNWNLLLLEPYRIELRNHHLAIRRQLLEAMLSAAHLMKDTYSKDFLSKVASDPETIELAQLTEELRGISEELPLELHDSEKIGDLLSALGRGFFYKLFIVLMLSKEMDYTKVESQIDYLLSKLKAPTDVLPTTFEMADSSVVLSDPLTLLLVDYFDQQRKDKYANRIDAMAGYLMCNLSHALKDEKHVLLLLTHSYVTHQILQPFLKRKIKLEGRVVELPLLRYPSYVNTYLIHSTLPGDYGENLEETVKWATALRNATSLVQRLPEHKRELQQLVEEAEEHVRPALNTLENLSAASNKDDFLAKCLADVQHHQGETTQLAVKIGGLLQNPDIQQLVVSMLQETAVSLLNQWTAAEAPIREEYRQRFGVSTVWRELEVLLLPTRRVLDFKEAIEDIKPYVFVSFADPRLKHLAIELVEDGPSWVLMSRRVSHMLPSILEVIEQAQRKEQVLFGAFLALFKQPAELDMLHSVIDEALLDPAIRSDSSVLAEFRFLQGIAYRLQGNYEAATSAVKTALQTKPDEPRFLKELGVLAWRASGEGRDPETDKEELGRALKLAIEYTEKAYSSLGTIEDKQLKSQIISNLSFFYLAQYLESGASEFLRKANNRVEELGQCVTDKFWYPEFRLVRGWTKLEIMVTKKAAERPEEEVRRVQGDLVIAGILCSRQADRDTAREQLNKLRRLTPPPTSEGQEG